MSRSNVPRWSASDAELPEGLAQLLRQGRDALGTGDEVAELGRRLAVALGPASGLLGAGEAGAPTTPSGAPDAVAADGASGGAAGATAPGPLGSSSEVGSAGRLSTATVGRNASWVWGGALALALSATGAGIWATRRAAPPNPTATVSSGAVAAPAAVVAAPATEPAVARLPTRDDDEIEPPAAPPSSATGASAVPAPPSARAHSHRSARQRDRLDEAALLRRAQSALGRDPSAALALTREHEARFPRGALAQEREVIAIEALRRLGDTAAASARAAVFERHYHGSVHRPRLDRGADTSAPAGAKATTVVP